MKLVWLLSISSINCSSSFQLSHYHCDASAGRTHYYKTIMNKYFTVNNTTTSAGAHLNIGRNRITCAKIRSSLSTSWKSGSLVRAKSWTSLTLPQEKHRTQKSEKTFDLHFMYSKLEKIANIDTVLRKCKSVQCLWRNK